MIDLPQGSRQQVPTRSPRYVTPVRTTCINLLKFASQRLQFLERVMPTLSPPLPTSFLPVAEERPAIVVSSTSWTADEDFWLLLEALSQYNSAAMEREAEKARGSLNTNLLPKVIVLISGKGPLRSMYLSEIARRESIPGRWKHVTVRTLWLSNSDYPIFLGSADFGISLHQSSSGLDLPMKVVDMFGCGIPVLARHFRW